MVENDIQLDALVSPIPELHPCHVVPLLPLALKPPDLYPFAFIKSSSKSSEEKLNSLKFLLNFKQSEALISTAGKIFLKKFRMKISYDKKYDLAYIEFSKKKPQRAVEIGKGIAVHVTRKDELVALEIFDAKKRVQIESLFELQEVER